MSGLRRCAVEVNFVSKLKKGSIQVSFYEYFLSLVKLILFLEHFNLKELITTSFSYTRR